LKSNATPIIDALKGKYLFIDNELQDGIQRLGLFGILARQGLGKRSGEKIPQLIFAILICPFLKVDFISSFCGKMAEKTNRFAPSSKPSNSGCFSYQNEMRNVSY
jgi:hypothetical protein